MVDPLAEILAELTFVPAPPKPYAFTVKTPSPAVDAKQAAGDAKLCPSHTPVEVLLELFAAMDEGARKYGALNWRTTGVHAHTYFDAALRHLCAWWRGEDLDPDSGLHHVVKAISSLTVLRDSMLRGVCTDDRPPAERARRSLMTTIEVKPASVAPSTTPPVVLAVRHTFPPTGFFVGRFPAPAEGAPDLLRGPNGEIAARITTRNEEQRSGAAVYQFLGHGEAWAQLSWVTEEPDPAPYYDSVIGSPTDPDYTALGVRVPWVPVASTPMRYAPHPFTVARLADGSIAPVVAVSEDQGETLSIGPPRKIKASLVVECFEFELRGSRHGGRAWAYVDNGMPFVRWEFAVWRLDGQAGGRVTATWPQGVCDLGQLLFGSLLCESVAVSSLRVGLDESSDVLQATIRNAAAVWPGLPETWDAPLLGLPVAHCPLALRAAAVRFAGSSFSASVFGRDYPNSGGADGSFGPSFTGLLWPEGGCIPGGLGVMARAAVVWASRPCHWREPGTNRPLEFVTGRALTMWAGQPYDTGEAQVLGVGPQFRGPTGEGRWTYDVEHESVGPLVLAAVLLDSSLLRFIADSYLGAQLYNRNVMNDWPGVGRGQGNPGIAFELLTRTVPENSPRLASSFAHRSLRQSRYLAHRVKGDLICVGGFYERGSTWSVKGTVTAIDGRTVTIEYDTPPPGQRVDTSDTLIVTDAAGKPVRAAVLATENVPLPESLRMRSTIAVDRDFDPALVGRPVESVGLYWDGYEQGTIVVERYLAGDMQGAYEHGRGLLASCYWKPDGTAASAYNVRALLDWPHPLTIGAGPTVDHKEASTALGTWASSGVRCFLLASKVLGIAGPDQGFARAFLAAADVAFAGITASNFAEVSCALSRALCGASV